MLLQHTFDLGVKWVSAVVSVVMGVRELNIDPDAPIQFRQFAQFLADSDELNEEIQTDVEITIVGPSDGSSLTESRRRHVRVKEYGNDGFEFVAETDKNGNITGYHSEGTSKVGKFVQDLADEFYGHHNYVCGFYEDDETSETTIVA